MTHAARNHAAIRALAALLAVFPVGRASAAPPVFEGLGRYRILDASGKIAPQGLAGGSDRVALRPAYPPPLLLRARPLYMSGYAGATYGPARPDGPPYPTTYKAATGRRFRHVWHGR